jgi:hypothetical protein
MCVANQYVCIIYAIKHNCYTCWCFILSWLHVSAPYWAPTPRTLRQKNSSPNLQKTENRHNQALSSHSQQRDNIRYSASKKYSSATTRLTHPTRIETVTKHTTPVPVENQNTGGILGQKSK